jgi:hypothetical protein
MSDNLDQRRASAGLGPFADYEAASPIVVAHDRIGFNVAADTWDGMHPNANGEVRIAASYRRARATTAARSRT